MDSFLQKFSLQNLLRQFFCGVVFFVPLWLYAHTQLGELAKVENWGIGNLFLFVSLASTIGTIIYHLEKNLYSYPLMCLYEKIVFKDKPKGEAIESRKGFFWLILVILGTIFI